MCAYGRPEPVKVESGAWWIPWRALSRVSGPRGGSTGDNPRAQTSFPARTSSRALPLPLPLTAPFLSRARANVALHLKHIGLYGNECLAMHRLLNIGGTKSVRASPLEAACSSAVPYARKTTRK